MTLSLELLNDSLQNVSYGVRETPSQIIKCKRYTPNNVTDNILCFAKTFLQDLFSESSGFHHVWH